MQTLKIFKKMRTEVTETGTGKQPNPAKDGSNSSNTSESDGSSQDGSQNEILAQQLPSEKPQVIGGNLAPPQAQSTTKEPSEGTTELKPISEPTTGNAKVSIKIDDPENQTETETAGTIGTVASNLEAQSSDTPINPPTLNQLATAAGAATIGTVDPDRDAQSSDPPINPSGPPSLYKEAAVVAFAALVAGVTTTVTGLVAQYIEREIRGGEELNSAFLDTEDKTELEIVLAEALVNCMRVIPLFIVDYVTENKKGLTANESIERCLKKIEKITCKMPKMLRDAINDALLQLVVGAFGLGAVWAMEQKTPADTAIVLSTIFHPVMNAGINTIRNYVWPNNSEQTKCAANLSDGFKVGGRAVSRGVQAAILASEAKEGLNYATPTVFGSVSVIKETLLVFCNRLAKMMFGNNIPPKINNDRDQPGSSNDPVLPQTMGRPNISVETALATPVLDGLLTPGVSVSAPAIAPAKTPAKAPAKTPDKAKPNNNNLSR